MPKTNFHSDRFYSALDAARVARDLSWREVARESGVSASSLTRIGQGKRPDVDSLSALCAWSGLDAGDFMELEGQREPEPLALISTYLRGDPNLTPDAAEMIDDLVRTSYARLRKRP
jgi:transcriptional regulator with XRE-family HTH domain